VSKCGCVSGCVQLIDGEKREPERRGVESIDLYSCETLMSPWWLTVNLLSSPCLMTIVLTKFLNHRCIWCLDVRM